MFKPELLSPAGSLKNMRYAFAYGADAVYAGQPRYSLRVRNNEFNNENLQRGIKEAHALGKKFYLAINIVPHNSKLKTFISDLEPVIQMRPNALIMSDPGLIMIARERFPEINIHLSVQANAVNWATVRFWKDIGLTRVILSRELSLEEIEEIRNMVPSIEIEVFVHGSLCIAYSGRCLLSGYVSRRDPNQGGCTNVCRWKYAVEEAKEDEMGNIVQKYKYPLMQKKNPTLGMGLPTDQIFMIEEKRRPGESMTTFEDEHGTYIMNSKDLCAISHVDRLTKMGIHSLKIEGRTKSFFYCARTAQAYRKAIDDAASGKPFDVNLLEMLLGIANRGYTEGFFRRHSHSDYQNYEHSYSFSKRRKFVGEFTGKRRGTLASVVVKNKFSVGERLELITPKKSIFFELKYMESSKREEILVAPGDGYVVWLSIPQKISLEYALLLSCSI